MSIGLEKIIRDFFFLKILLIVCWDKWLRVKIVFESNIK